MDHSRVEERQDVGMVERAAMVISRWNRSAPSTCGQVGPQDLDGDLAVMLEVIGQVDRGHAAAPDRALEGVPAGQDLG